MRLARVFSVCGWLTLLTSLAAGQSLWSPDSKGLLSDPPGVGVGELVVVDVNASTALSFRSLQNDSKGMTLELSGGGQGELFSFLPSGSTSADRAVRGSSELSFQASVGALVREVSPAGLALVQGERRITLDNREESVSVSGWLHPRDLGDGRRVGFERLADARIVFRTVLQPVRDTLRAEDLREPVPPAAVPAGAAAPGAPPAGAGPAVGTPAPVAVPDRLTLSEEKKRELLLQSLNRIVDILFQ